jgi:putative peptide zinc metalloprotease protein
MNIVRALEVALPELPERVIRKNPPKLDPKVIFKEHIENGQPVVLVKAPGTEQVFRFVPIQWRLVQMFDGDSSAAEIAERFQNETGSFASEEDVKELASFIQANGKLFYATPLERNITLQQELRSSRKKRSRFQVKDFSDITLKTWNNADKYISWLYPRVRFMFTPWFVWTTIGMFALMAWMWADRFREVWDDSFAFYNFMQKSGTDLIEFWFLFGAMAAIHETAHGLVGKHFGATIEKMGFSLMYFTPSFFCDATQVWIIGGKWARIATAFAGIWLDLVVCFFATIVWWGTATGMPIHDWAYKVMMITGIGVSLLNLNPLIKLDGYLIFCELVAEPSLKEDSTAYLSAWIKKHFFRLPVEVNYVPRRKRLFYISYAILSGLYSYSLLTFLMAISYHILRSFSPEWAFVPAIAIGSWVFRSRMKMAVKFMKMLYLDKKERVREWFTPTRMALSAVAALLVLFLPVWPDFVDGPFVLTAANRVVLHSAVAGTVDSVSVQEGQKVTRGTPLLRMRNVELESQAARAHAELSGATEKASQAALRYSDFASAEQERRQFAENDRLSLDKLARLAVVSPIAGTVVTSHTTDLVGRPLDGGDLLMELADTSQMNASVYLPEFAMRDLRINEPVRLLLRGRALPLSGKLSRISPVVASIPQGLIARERLEGINPPRFYSGTVRLTNDGGLLEGMAGTAKILVARRSLADFGFRWGRDLLQRKFW